MSLLVSSALVLVGTVRVASSLIEPLLMSVKVIH